MSQPVPSEPDSKFINSESEPSIQQNSDSSTMNGGMQGAIGNNNHQTQNTTTYNQWIQIGSRDKVLENRINELQKDFRDFQQRYDSLLKTLDNFRTLIIAKLEDSPSEQNKLVLTDTLEKLLKYQSDFKRANKNLEASQRAAEWLSEKREQVVLDTRYFVINYYQNRKQTTELLNLNLSLEQIEQFCKDIDNYLFWIGNEMVLGKLPNSCSVDFISSSLPKSVYQKAFRFLVKRKFVNIPELDDNAIKCLNNYIVRFIIKPMESS